MSGKESSAKKTSVLKNLSQNKKLLIPAAILLLLISLVATAWIALDNLLGNINFVDDHPGNYEVSFGDINAEDDPVEGAEYAEVDSEEYADAVDSVAVDEDNLFYQEGTTNILLLGTDNRIVGGGARSDVVILFSINRNTKKFVMTSIMRDTAVALGDTTRIDKLAHGYAYGKAPMVVDTVQRHFGIRVDQYVVIDFYAFIDAVDYLGGIELDVSEDERQVMNGYIREINRRLKLAEEDGFLLQCGENVHLTGKQALGYARNRYSNGTADFGRTERQRKVLTKLIEKIKEDPTKAVGLLELIGSQITTDYDKLELLSEVFNVSDYIDYETVQMRVPADGTWYYATINNLSVVACDFEANQKYMLEGIYEIDMDEYSVE